MSMSDFRALTQLRMEAGPFLAPHHVIFQQIHEIASTPQGVLPGELKNDVQR